MAVEKYQANRSADLVPRLLQGFTGHTLTVVGRHGAKWDFGDRSHAGKLPVLIPTRRKSELIEALHGRLAQPVDPRLAVCRGFFLEPGKVRPVRVLLVLQV